MDIKSKDKKIYDGENKYKAIPVEIRNLFINKLENNKFLKPLCYTMMMGGLRTGEALALTWNDINFKDKKISINKASTIIPIFNQDGSIKERVTVVGSTKTAGSVRSVPLPIVLENALLEYKKLQKTKGYKLGLNLISDKCFVFANDDGSIRTYYGTRSIFKRFLKKYDLEKYNIHFHGLRHTYSNTLFEAGQNPKLIQSLLGHKSVNTTLVTYNSIDSAEVDKATNILNDIYKSKIKIEKIDEEDLDFNNDEIDELVLKLLKMKKKKDFEM